MHTNSRWIKDTDNNIVIIKGVSKTGLEYLGLDLDSIIPEMIQFDIKLMNKWHINTVRIPLRDMHWLTNNQYRIKTDNFIASYLSAGYNIILDLHTLGSNQYQDKFIIRSNGNDGLEFWSKISKTYKNDKIFYELFNEPYGISPSTWWYGDNTFYGYKTILNEIRKNTNNICIIGGLDYAYQWKFLANNLNIMNEMKNISNIVLSFHPYGYRGGPTNDGVRTLQIPTVVNYPRNSYIGDCSIGYTIPSIPKTQYGWYESFGYLSEEFPMIATEFGLDRDDTSLQGGWYSNDILEYLGNNSIGYIAWAWTQDRLSYPSLLDKNFEPTGMTYDYPHGPPCGVRDNNYYKGPGAIVFSDLNNRSYERKLKYNFIKKSVNERGRNMNYKIDNISNIPFDHMIVYLGFLSIMFIVISILMILAAYLINKFITYQIYNDSKPVRVVKSDEEKRKEYCNKLRSRSLSSKLNICVLEQNSIK